MPPDAPREFRPVNIAVLTVSDTRTLATESRRTGRAQRRQCSVAARANSSFR